MIWRERNQHNFVDCEKSVSELKFFVLNTQYHCLMTQHEVTLSSSDFQNFLELFLWSLSGFHIVFKHHYIFAFSLELIKLAPILFCIQLLIEIDRQTTWNVWPYIFCRSWWSTENLSGQASMRNSIFFSTLCISYSFPWTWVYRV